MKNKLLSLGLVGVMTVSLAACGGGGKQTTGTVLGGAAGGVACSGVGGGRPLSSRSMETSLFVSVIIGPLIKPLQTSRNRQSVGLQPFGAGQSFCCWPYSFEGSRGHPGDGCALHEIQH